MAKAGRPKSYKDPEKELWEDFLEYKQKTKERPRLKVEYVGKDGDMVKTPLEVPLTISGFENYVFEKRGINIHDYLYSSEERYAAFSTVRYRVRRFVRQDQIEGGMVGQYNSNITQRLNGLTDKREVNATVDAPVFKGINLDVPEDNSTE